MKKFLVPKITNFFCGLNLVTYTNLCYTVKRRATAILLQKYKLHNRWKMTSHKFICPNYDDKPTIGKREKNLLGKLLVGNAIFYSAIIVSSWIKSKPCNASVKIFPSEYELENF